MSKPTQHPEIRTPDPMAHRGKSPARQYVEALGLALILALVMRASFVEAYVIPSGSMEPTLLVGDHLLVNKIIYGLRMPDSIFGLHVPGLHLGKYLFRLEAVHRGDIVIFVSPRDRTLDLIKRVIGIPGDRIEVRSGVVWRNGEPADDPHAHFEVAPENRSGENPRDNLAPITVPPGKLFMMGDNRDNSFDSRFWGFADEGDVEGRPMVITWSWNSDGTSIVPLRWSRCAKVVD
jgi:signal peptidase I